MKTTLLSVAAAIAAPVVFAQQPSPLQPLVSTTGSAQIRVVPDLADLAFEIEVRNADIAIARKQQAERATKILAALRGAGVAEAELQSSQFPQAQQLANVTDETLRGCGFSRAKTAALRDIAKKTLSGVVPTSRAIVRMRDEEIIGRLTAVRGVGRWTVEMLLIFKLGRPDVLPADDFGVRNGLRIAFNLPALPSPKEVLARGECWRPHATTAAWYLWRAADEAQTPKAGAKAKLTVPK